MILRGGILLTNNSRRDIFYDRSLRISGGRIDAILPPDFSGAYAGDDIIDASGMVVMPGFVQTHLHLCQTLFRGLADDLNLLDWLQKKIFPFEAAHNERSMHRSASLGIAELIRSGTTTILDMGSVNFEEEIIKAVAESGMRAHLGKAMMDVNDAYPPLRESTTEALRSTRSLAEKWHNSFDGRIRYAPAPRFVLSCTEELLRSAGELAAGTEGMILHTHASESRQEIELVKKKYGVENIELLDRFGILSRKACLAHCVHVNDREVDILRTRESNVTHCPSSNLKLGSGIADIPKLRARGINVSIGADGAPCNNTLDAFHEMRLASLLQKPVHGPASMPAQEVFHMATLGGAKALGLDQSIGSIEPGKKADIVLLNLDEIWNPLDPDLYSSIVYSGSPENVDSVMVEGTWLYRKKEFVSLDQERILAESRKELHDLLSRVR